MRNAPGPTILITGGLGFIFSHVAEHFVDKGWKVHIADNLSEGSHPEVLDALKKSIHFYNVDVSTDEISKLIKRLRPEYIIHAAANSDVDNSIANPEFTFVNNAISTVKIFEACRALSDLKRLLYVSTDEVYGECDHKRKEDEILFPRNPYSLSKAVGSILRLAWDNTYEELNKKTVESRFCNIFGPRQDARKIIPAIKRALDTGQPITLHNEGIGYREWLYVKEIPTVVETLLKKGHRTYNITANKGYTVKGLIEKAEKIMGRTVPVVQGKRAGLDVRYQMDGSRFAEEFMWQPRYDFDEAFEATIRGVVLL